MTIEQLSDDERAFLFHSPPKATVVVKALRIIDAQREGIAQAERNSAYWETLCRTAEARVRELEAEVKAERDSVREFSRKMREAEAQVAELTRERDEARDKYEALSRDRALVALVERAEAAEADRDVWRRRSHAGVTPELEALESEVTRLTDELKAAERDIAHHARARNAAHNRAEAAEARARELEHRRGQALTLCSERETMLKAAESECAALRAVVEQRNEEVASAGDRIAALRAEVERLRTDNRDLVEVSNGFAVARNAAESRLAAAFAHAAVRDIDALLRPVDSFTDIQDLEYREAQDAHLSAQPATAPARDETEPPCRGCREGTQDRHTCQRAVIPPQTYVPPSVLRARLKEAEQRVLDACANWQLFKTEPSSTGQWSLIYGDVMPVAEAVLALRAEFATSVGGQTHDD